MPNTFAYIVIFSWPIIALVLTRRLGLSMAVAVAVIGGFLLLPTATAVNLPILPKFDKDFSAVLAGLLVFWSKRKTRFPVGGATPLDTSQPQPGWLPSNILFRLCLLALFGGIILTSLTNTAPLVYGPRVLQGMAFYDILNSVQTAIVSLIPLLLGRKFFASPRDQAVFLTALAVAGILYSFPVLLEVRLSPQLSKWIYGFFPHSFKQHVRGDGFRPLVFMSHGLVLSLFLSLSLLASLACSRLDGGRQRLKFLGAAGFLFVTLVLSKSLGALAIAFLFVPVMIFAKPRMQVLFSAAVAAIVLTYPALRSYGVIPTEQVTAIAETIDETRARSLNFRLINEDALLAKAAEKPLLGWGGWGRWRVYNAAGEDITVSDGRWVIDFVSGGWVRYIAIFGLLCLPIIVLVFRRSATVVDTASAATALILAANLVDLLPNAGLTPLSWLLAGSLIGRLEYRVSALPAAPSEAAKSAGSSSREGFFSPGTAASARVSGPKTGSTRSPYAPILPSSANHSHSRLGNGFRNTGG